MDAGALDAQQDAQVDGGPAGVRLAAVAAMLVAWQQLDPLQDALPADAALPRLAGRIDAAGGRRGRSVQVLDKKQRKVNLKDHRICSGYQQYHTIKDMYYKYICTHILNWLKRYTVNC